MSYPFGDWEPGKPWWRAWLEYFSFVLTFIATITITTLVGWLLIQLCKGA